MPKSMWYNVVADNSCTTDVSSEVGRLINPRAG